MKLAGFQTVNDMRLSLDLKLIPYNVNECVCIYIYTTHKILHRFSYVLFTLAICITLYISLISAGIIFDKNILLTTCIYII